MYVGCCIAAHLSKSPATPWAGAMLLDSVTVPGSGRAQKSSNCACAAGEGLLALRRALRRGM